MSSLINKAKDALSGHKEHNNTTTTSSATHHHENVPANTTHNTTGNLYSTTNTAAAPTGDAHNLVGGSNNPMGTYTEPTHDPRGANAHSHVTDDDARARNHNALGREPMPTETTKSGPVHHNEALNKLDPRVHKHQHTATTGTGVASGHRPSDPRNAAHVPPSVLKEHVGEPTVEHDYPEDSTHKRHSVSHQEQHLMK
ncbi:uncharacterized protein F5Z01DRAFT_673987 [Emericellopsis atlantica]|uniref:Uncharacterized protein n=1 Tax=Emericellopsis atlantica TaxID=2614577 RepID=A0A9P7ZNB8_9HYPO|nr:uncharacterized protein F5Z01DRAFT_673987 [Emericellopsis atlantica]KAG9254841.1 hypothetical protein F5Z01DRAFT_673987 [Emericellopsis atlantica]